jgi:hypothetical protein
VGIYEVLTDTLHECRNLERRRAFSFLGIYVSNFWYSVRYGVLTWDAFLLY